MKRLAIRANSARLCTLLLLATVAGGVAQLPGSPSSATPPAGALAALNYAPTSRTLAPTGVYSTSGSVSNPTNVLSGASTRISGTNSAISLDFGKEVGGLITLSFGSTSDSSQRVGLAFSESSLYVGTSSDASSGGAADGAIYGSAPSGGTYTMPTARLRGGFRYLTVFLNTSGWVDLRRVSLNFTAAPGMADPSAYPNYFYSNDDLLNKIWYAGAYTVQMDTIASNQGRAWPPPSSEWDNSATVSVGSTVLVDGAKRDRTVWPGDLGVAVPTQYASTNDLVSTRNALTTMFNAQAASGAIPWSGPVFNLTGSDTYHTWTLLGSATYYSYSADRAWLDSVWSRYKLGMTYIINKIDSNSLLNVAATQDWARSGQGGENIEANAILYAALVGGANLATAEGDAALASTYSSRAAAIKSAANSRLWNASAGMYRDNPTSSMYPQDGNSLAVWYGLTDTTAKSTSISQKLATRWNTFGAVTPEWGGVHPFPGSMEVNAHLVAGDDYTALAQIRRTWGYMLNSPLGTKSTFWEGISADGSLAYGGPFMSLAHGWSSGPTASLTFSVLGIAPQAQIGQYRFVPHPGDLTSVEGRITMPQGAVNASWSRNAAAGTFNSQLVSPSGTTGTIGVPKFGSSGVSVSVNGAVVWSGGVFTARPGITGGTQDDKYIYLTGVAPGTYTVAATGVGNPAPPTLPSLGPAELPGGYTKCATEGGQCSFSGTRMVAYGAGSYAYKQATSSMACTSDAFNGDPAANILKSCYVAPQGGPSGYTLCAAENGTCSFSGYGRNIAYGANGVFNYQVVSASVTCSNDTFGDALPGVVKSCYLPPAGAPGSGWTQCSAEGGTCAAVSGQRIAYGAYGAFNYTTATGATSCSNATFGDPVANESKACYTRTGSPAGYSTTCAAEGGTCTFSGTQTVAYGARGVFLYKTFTGSAACTTAAFGSDPLFGVAKSCYLTP
jgi:hypothetical protein